MAEFKLSRLRFTWSGTWATDTFYNRDAIVLHEGKAYVCLVPHTSSNFYDDLAETPIAYWDLQLEGSKWIGEWAPNTSYSLRNIVHFGGEVYSCNTAHTSVTSFATDEAKWTTIAISDHWYANWTTSRNYGIGDIVRYGGNVYRCNDNHVSAATAILGLEADLAKWDVYIQGVDFKGNWSPNSQYRINELVKLGADVWQCTTAHPAQASFNPSYWTMFLPGEKYTTTWSSVTSYNLNDIVNYGGYDYRSTSSNNLGNIPSSGSGYWEVITTGFREQGEWDNVTPYKEGSVVRRGGRLFIAKANNTGTDPLSNSIAATYEPTGSSGTTLNVTGTYVSNITVGQVVIGDGFRKGQTVISTSNSGQTILLNEAPDSTPAGPLTFVGVNNPTWELIVPGIRWRGFWDQGLTYVIGDLVLWQNATYRCINPHSALVSNSPAADSTNTYWAVYLLHARNNAANTVGDITIYQNNAYTSVPIGPDEYSLRVTNDIPSWRFINKISNVYYVSTDGTDDLMHGVTLDKPWKTIRYACQTLLNGTINQNAAYLLKANKEFMVEEMYQWMIYQKTNSISPFTPASTFDATKTRRDARYVIDAVIYDITRGGTSQTVAATLAYFATSTTFFNAEVTAEMPYFIAALNYLGTLTQSILSNTAVTNNYQLLNSVPSPISQTINTNYFAETGQIVPANSSTITVTNSGSMAFVLNGIGNVTLNLVRGNTYTFSVNAVGHPLWIQTQGGGYNATKIFSEGVLNAGTDNGSITFTIPYHAPDTLYYQCQNHAMMFGIINVYNASASVSAVPSATATVDSLFNILTTALTNSSTATVPVPYDGISATIFVKTGTYSEQLPITIPANVAVVGDELRGVTVQPATSYVSSTTLSNATNSSFTVISTEGLTANMPVQFVGTTFGNVTAGTTYYVRGTSITPTSFSVSTSPNGGTFALSNEIGFMRIYAGEALKDMFYMRNSSGLRNLTLSGLLGTLTTENQWATKRTTGGSFVSLDPGLGPNDTSAWIYRRSPYVQNVTTFGEGCNGLKIDGSLHNGGNKSIVANDFTHIISDGIGCWCTNSGALTELISVFTYYNYVGYLAENGGRIRAANGNSSYGTFGVIAEGFDATEIPLTGAVFNKSTQVQASVQSSLGLNAQLLKLQYGNSGRNYTTTTTNLLKYTNNFLNGVWSNDGYVGFQQNTTAPTGFAEAWTLTTNSATANQGYIEQAVTITPSGAAYTALNGTNLSGSGSGATFDVTVTGQGSYAVAVNVASSGGTGYVVGNQIKISGAVLGGLDGTNDLIITVASLTSSSIATVTSTGTVPVGSSKPYLVSLYVKAGTASYLDVFAKFSGSTAVSSRVKFAFSNGAVTPSVTTLLGGTVAGSLPTQYGAIPQTQAGWYRLWFTIWDKIGLNDTLTVRVYPNGYDARTTGVYSNIYGAQIQTDVTDATLGFYLENTAVSYTAFANYQITGSGSGAVIQSDEIRSKSVFETRVTNGGDGYLTASNNAQGGTNTYVILAGSDNNTSSKYIGMRAFITSGTGTGQYGYISAYNSGTKIAQVLKESFDVLTVTASSAADNSFTITGSQDSTSLYLNQIVQFIPTYYNVTVTNSARGSSAVTSTIGGTTNTLYAASTAYLQLHMPVTFSGTVFGSVTTGFTYYVSYIDPDGHTFSVATQQYGTDWQLTTASGSMTVNFPTNTGYLTGSTTNMSVNMPITFSGSIFGGVATATTYYVNSIVDATTFSISANLATVAITDTTVTTNVLTTSDNTSSLTTFNPIVFSGSTFGNIANGTVYYVNRIVNSTTFSVTSSLITRTATATNGTSDLVTVSSTTGFVANQPVVFSGTSFGDITPELTYYILAINDGVSFTISSTPGGSAVNLSSGVGSMIVRTTGGDFTLSTASGTMTGTTTTPKTLTTSATGSMNATIATPLFGGVTAGTNYYILSKSNGSFTVTATDGGVAAVTLSNATGSMSLAAVGWDHIIPGYPIASSLDSSSIYFIEPRLSYSDPAFSQSSMTLVNQGSNTYTALDYGNGYFMAVAGSSAAAARSIDGVTWTSVTMPTASNWSGIAFGNSYWVAVASGTDTIAYSSANGLGWRTATLPVSASWIGVVYGAGKFVAIANGSSAAYSTNNGATWSAGNSLPSATWTGLCYGGGIFVAVATSGTQAAYSSDGITWTSSTLPTSTNWTDVVYGNGRFVAISSAGTKTAYSFDGITWYESNLLVSGTKIAYGQGVFVVINSGSSVAYTSDDGVNWKQRTVTPSAYTAIHFGYTGTSYNGVFVTAAGSQTGSNIFAGVRAKGRTIVTSNVITGVNMWEAGSNYTSLPTVTFTDPNNTSDAVIVPRTGNGSLGNPTIINKGVGYSLNSTTVTITGNGYADSYQVGYTLICDGLSRIPSPGDDLTIAGNSTIYKVTSASVMYGTVAPNIEANIQVSPNITADVSPDDGTAISVITKYSQVRLTGHDMLSIGYGNIYDSNYPSVPVETSLQAQNQTVENNYGRVFYTTGDQDGNFKVGNLFGVEQATGIVTLSASQFGLTGLETLSLGGIAVGGSSVVITQFSTDGTLAANSDTIIPTQKAIKAYVTSRLSQGGSNTFTGNLIAGTISVGNPNFITNQVPEGIAGSRINMPKKVTVKGPAGAWAGDGAALTMFAGTWNRKGSVPPGR